MDFRPTPDQELLQHTARDVLARYCPLEAAPGSRPGAGDGSDARVRRAPEAAAADGRRELHAALWPRLAELGWPGLLVPADLGGSDGTILDVALLVEQMGYAGLDSPYVDSAVVATALLLAAGGAGHRGVVAELAQGRRVAAVALLEEDGELGPDGVRARGEPGGFLAGRKLLVADADLADELVVAARGRAGVSLFRVGRERPGVRVEPMASMAGDRLFEIELDQVAVREADLVGAEGAGWELVEPAARLGAIARSAEMIGAARRILELAVEHARTRVQSGRPIGAFQAIQHACADLARGVESARPLVLAAAWKAAQGHPSAADVAMAKLYAADACLAVARRAHQIFGAVGYCDEHPLHRFHKKIIAARLAYGDPAHHAETIASAIGLA